MKTFTFILFIFFLGPNIFSQNKKYYGAEGIERIKQEYNYIPYRKGSGDSLLINNNVFYFKSSPLLFLDGAEYVLFDDVMVLPQIDAGYDLVWAIEDGKLLIKSIHACRPEFDTGMKPTEKEAQRKMEAFLGRNFDENGLFADFVTGKFVIYKYALSLRACGEASSKYTIEEQKLHRKKLLKKQEVFTIEFNDGILINYNRNKQFERKFKKYIKALVY